MLLMSISVPWRFTLAISALPLRPIVISLSIVIIKLVCSLTAIRLLVPALLATLLPAAALLSIASITSAAI
jgi:hypothetical protein